MLLDSSACLTRVNTVETNQHKQSCIHISLKPGTQRRSHVPPPTIHHRGHSTNPSKTTAVSPPVSLLPVEPQSAARWCKWNKRSSMVDHDDGWWLIVVNNDWCMSMMSDNAWNRFSHNQEIVGWSSIVYQLVQWSSFHRQRRHGCLVVDGAWQSMIAAYWDLEQRRHSWLIHCWDVVYVIPEADSSPVETGPQISGISWLGRQWWHHGFGSPANKQMLTSMHNQRVDSMRTIQLNWPLHTSW